MPSVSRLAHGLRKKMSKLRWEVISGVHRRSGRLGNPVPLISFTFDDFPRTALTVGGRILRDYGATGTYFASMGLMNKVSKVGRQFAGEDLHRVLEEGHELGSHTFHHVSARKMAPDAFVEEARKGRSALEVASGHHMLGHFSYPFGHATWRSKKRVGAEFKSCRGSVPGINLSPVDLNLLRANSLYSSSMDLNWIRELLEANRANGGWLIFYTHDVCDEPSPFGCTPADFRVVVDLAAHCEHSRIMRVGDVVQSIQNYSTTEQGL